MLACQQGEEIICIKYDCWLCFRPSAFQHAVFGGCAGPDVPVPSGEQHAFVAHGLSRKRDASLDIGQLFEAWYEPGTAVVASQLTTHTVIAPGALGSGTPAGEASLGCEIDSAQLQAAMDPGLPSTSLDRATAVHSCAAGGAASEAASPRDADPSSSSRGDDDNDDGRTSDGEPEPASSAPTGAQSRNHVRRQVTIFKLALRDCGLSCALQSSECTKHGPLWCRLPEQG